MVKARNLSSKSFQDMFSLSLLCSCPRGAEITTLTVNDCPFDVGQTQKIIFQRVYETGSTRNEMTVSEAALEATWTALFAANDSTKTSISSFVEDPNTDGGDAREFGSGNAVLGGIPRITGKNPTSFRCVLRSPQSLIAEQLNNYMCETLGVYLITENGKIIGITDSNASPTKFYPIPIRSFFIGDRKAGGFEEPDNCPISWRFLPNWSLKLKEITPSDFEALIDLTNAAT